ncbi:MAG: NAD(P)-dependent oxidoreductase [Clostridia bacterium]
MRIGFVGLGVMGQAMALNLVKGGHTLRVYNRTPGRADILLAAGAERAETPAAAAAGADVTIVIVTDDRAVRAVAEGDSGVLAGAARGSLVVDMSTISPETTRALNEAADARGITWLDAPVTGGDIGAREGTLTIMVGGSKDAFGRVKPVLDLMGRRVVYIGDSGLGQTMKLVGNFISGLTLMVAAEGVRLGEAAGLTLDQMNEVLPFSSAQSFELGKIIDRWGRRVFDPGFSVANRTKDMRLAVEMAEELNFALALGAVGFQFWAGHAARHPSLDESSIAQHWG